MNTKPGSQSGTVELTKAPVTMSQRSLRSHQLVCQLTAGPHPNRKFRSCLSLYCLSLTCWWAWGFAPTSSEKLNFSWLFLPLANYCAKSGSRASPVWNATESNFSYPKYTRTNGMLINLLNVLNLLFWHRCPILLLFFIFFKILFYSFLPYCFFLEGSAQIPLSLFRPYRPLKFLLHPSLLRHSPEPSSTFCHIAPGNTLLSFSFPITPINKISTYSGITWKKPSSPPCGCQAELWPPS